MVRVKLIFTAILTCALVLMPVLVKAQTERVKINFKIDGKEVEDQAFKVLIYTGDEIIGPEVVKHGFAVPPEISGHEKVDVRIIFGEYDLRLWSMTQHHFDSEWTVEVVNPPFKEEAKAVAAQEGKELKLIYRITFATTIWVTYVYK